MEEVPKCENIRNYRLVSAAEAGGFLEAFVRRQDEKLRDQNKALPSADMTHLSDREYEDQEDIVENVNHAAIIREEVLTRIRCLASSIQSSVPSKTKSKKHKLNGENVVSEVKADPESNGHATETPSKKMSKKERKEQKTAEKVARKAAKKAAKSEKKEKKKRKRVSEAFAISSSETPVNEKKRAKRVT